MRRLVLLALVVVACSPAAGDDGFVLSEFSVDGPRGVTPGRVDLAISNEGEFGHTLVVTDDAGHVVASTDVLPGGTGTTLAVDLDPGEYQVSCRIVVETPDGRLVDHYEQGMYAPLTVED